MSMMVDSLADWLQGEVIGNGSRIVETVQSLSKAGPKSITFYTGERNLLALKGSAAGVILISRDLRDAVSKLEANLGQTPTFLVVEDPKVAFLTVAARLAPRRLRPSIGISTDAYVSATAQIGKNTNIHPGAHIGSAVVIGDNCDIHPGTVICRGCRIGDDCVIHPNAVLYEESIIQNRVIIHAGAVIGADGFGYRTVNGMHERIPHFGTVRIEDDVEVGANTTIDRAMVGETVIGQGTKLDNLVMIGHNCEIGRHNLFVSQVGLAGSVTTGDYVVCAGQVGIADHVHLGHRSVLGAKAGVHKDVPDGGRYIGVPAIPEADCLRVVMAQHKLPAMRQQLKALERQIEELSNQLKKIAPQDPAPQHEQEKRTRRDAA